MFPPDDSEEKIEVLEEIITEKIEYFKRLFRPNAKITEDTEGASNLKKDFLRKYRLMDIMPLKPYNINTFIQIGIDDPFPDDDKKYIGSIDDVDPSIF